MPVTRITRIYGWPLINGAILHRQMGLRGITAQQLAQASGVTAETLSRIRRGYIRVRPSTMAKIAKGLLKYPVLEGVELLLDTPEPDGDVLEDKMVGGTHGDQLPVERVIRTRRPDDPNEGVVPEFVGGLKVIDMTPKPKHRPTAPSP